LLKQLLPKQALSHLSRKKQSMLQRLFLVLLIAAASVAQALQDRQSVAYLTKVHQADSKPTGSSLIAADFSATSQHSYIGRLLLLVLAKQSYL
jgi:hypothetical protein